MTRSIILEDATLLPVRVCNAPSVDPIAIPIWPYISVDELIDWMRQHVKSLKPIVLPIQPYISLNKLIDWMGEHVVEIPSDLAEQIESFDARWKSSLFTLNPEAYKRSILFPPQPQLTSTYRKWRAAAHLYENLVIIEDHKALWKNWSVTGEPRYLRPDERYWAISVLESIARAAERHLWATLNGERRFNPAADINFPTDLDEKQRYWLNSLGFEKKEIFAALSPEFIAEDISEQEHALALDAIVPTRTDQSKPTCGVKEPKTPPMDIDRFPSSGEIAEAFAGLLNKNKDQWRNLLKDPPGWLKAARITKGSRGSPGATWDPREIATAILNGVPIEIPLNKRGGKRYEKVKTTLSRLDGIFRKGLPTWDLAWQSMRANLESYSD